MTTPTTQPSLQSVQCSLRIGPYHVRPLPTGIFGLDGGAMFGTVPKVLWEKTNPADDQNRIQMEARALLLDGASNAMVGHSSGKSGDPILRILVDCGIGADFSAKYGEKLGAKFSEMYAIDQDENASTAVTPIEKNLLSMGLKVDDITDVILTHLHFDHAGGATCVRNGRLVPTFPKARYYVQRANLETAEQPNLRERASYYSANFQPLLDAGVLTLLDGPTENLLPGISVTVTNGHTQGQQIVRVSDGTKTLVYCGDLIPTSTHIRLPWVMGYDLEPLKLIEEKRELLTPAAKGDWYLFFEHDPYFDAAQVSANKDDFMVRERYRLE